MKHLLPTLAVTALGLILPMSAEALPPPDNATTDSISTKDIVTAHFSDVDDVGLLLVWNGDGVQTVGTCEWVSGQGGAMTKRLDETYLKKGRNYLIFAIYNKVYGGTGLFAGGKWSGDLKLKKNGTTIWSDSHYVRENDKEIKYWKTFILDVNSSGEISIQDRIPADDLAALRRGMAELEQLLNDNAPIARPF